MNIGGVIIDWFSPTVSEDDSPAGKGFPSVTIGGAAPHGVVDELREVTRNYRNRRTVGGETGIQQYIEFECAPLTASWDGWYLLQGLSTSVDKVRMDAIASTGSDLGEGDTAVLSFSIKAVYIGPQP